MKNGLQFDWLKLSLLIHIYWDTHTHTHSSICNIANVKHPFKHYIIHTQTHIFVASHIWRYSIRLFAAERERALAYNSVNSVFGLVWCYFFPLFIFPFTIHFIFIWAAEYLFSLFSLLNKCVSHTLAYYIHMLLLLLLHYIHTSYLLHLDVFVAVQHNKNHFDTATKTMI